jgi:hypothetical protein
VSALETAQTTITTTKKKKKLLQCYFLASQTTTLKLSHTNSPAQLKVTPGKKIKALIRPYIMFFFFLFSQLLDLETFSLL